ncbi:hypothetical protein G5B46_16685 [Caulobacter sp. 602-2]|uniref:Uncharacterized protein n=1 Tax=Caulobacter sp. 602-2 TaxID=2710887 RepID=A0A6G4R0K7_9CAUL|nr:hypothetical protein [Caulobacter sp. 602-2]NGM51247.1 hypothetical protein [Caulobacter sp. 602-2]
MNQRTDIKLVGEALKEAAWKARHGTREERAGKFLGKQAAVEKAVATLQKKSGD